MSKRLLLIALFLACMFFLPSGLSAQCPLGSVPVNNPTTRAFDCSVPSPTTFASPPSSPRTNQAYLFTDASATGTCTGGGTSMAYCVWNGSAWQAVAGTSTGLGDPGANSIVFRNGAGTSIPATASQMSGPSFCQDAGSTGAYACNLSPVLASYVTGTIYWFKANTANTGVASINFNTLGVKTIKKSLGGITTDLAANDILAGQWVQIIYDGTNMQMVSPQSNGLTSTVNDTNVTLSLSGAGVLTAGWSGTLAAARLNANVVQAFTNDTNITATISAQNATLAWSGTLAPARGGLGGSFAACTGVPTFSSGTATCTALTGTLGSVVGSVSPTFTGTVTVAALTATGVLTTNVTGGGVQCLQASNTGVVTGTGFGCSTTPALSSITAATTSSTLANGDNPWVLNSAMTTASRIGTTFGETSAATSTGSPYRVQVVTLAGSTAIPLNITNSLTGSQTLPSLSITPTWNTTGVADAGIFENVTNTASGTGSLLIDLQVGGTSQFKVDKAGNLTVTGSISTGVGGSNAGSFPMTQGTDNTSSLGSNQAGFQAPTSVPTSYLFTLPSAQAAGLWRSTNASPSVISIAELSGDATTSGSNVVTVVKVNSVSYPTTGSLFPALPTLIGSNTITYQQINGGSACGDSTHAVSVTSGGVFGCQAITGSASVTGASGGVVYNNAGAATSITGWSSNGTTGLTANATAVFDMSAGNATTNIKLPGAFGTGLLRVTTSTGAVSSAEISGDCTTSGSNALTCTQLNGSNFTVNSSGVPTKIDGLTTAGIGTQVTIGLSNVTAQTSSQSTVTLATSPAAGGYKIEYYGDMSTAGNGCTVSFTFNWTDVTTARSLSTGNLNLGTQSVGSFISGTFPIWVGSGNVTYTSTVTGSCGAGAYDIHPWLVRIQ